MFAMNRDFMECIFRMRQEPFGNAKWIAWNGFVRLHRRATTGIRKSARVFRRTNTRRILGAHTQTQIIYLVRLRLQDRPRARQRLQHSARLNPIASWNPIYEQREWNCKPKRLIKSVEDHYSAITIMNKNNRHHVA